MKWKSYFFVISLLIIVLFANCKAGERKSEVSLKDALKGKFLIGVAMNADQITGKDTAGVRLIKQHFNSITPRIA
jgi:endo-1,4-beta-xylanase